MNTRPDNIDEYLATLPDDKRMTLEEVRRMINAAAPDAVEGIGYGMPGYKYRGRPLIYFAAASKHCGLYGDIARAMDAHRDLLAGYDTSKGTLRFPPGEPPPESLVHALVKARMAEIDAAEGKRKTKRSEKQGPTG